MKVGLFTIVKNEHSYLEEWVQYHLNPLLGIHQIYIFDDPFSKPHDEICNRFPKDRVIHQNILSMYPKSWQEKILNRTDYKETTIPRQLRYMFTVLEYFKSKHIFDWVFYLDSDEFLTLADNEKESIPDILNAYKDYDILSVSWKNYGASGHLNRPDGGVIENYTIECPVYVGSMSTNASSKLCFNLNRWNSTRIRSNHHLVFKGKWCKTNFSKDSKELVYDRLYIRHYITKSLEEFVSKVLFRGQFFGSKTINSFFLFNKDINKNDPEVQKVINKYRDMYYSGEVKFSIF